MLKDLIKKIIKRVKNTFYIPPVEQSVEQSVAIELFVGIMEHWDIDAKSIDIIRRICYNDRDRWVLLLKDRFIQKV